MTRLLTTAVIAVAVNAAGALLYAFGAAVAVAGMLGAFESEHEDCPICWNKHEDCRRCAARRKR